jgi:hypothetical protein
MAKQVIQIYLSYSQLCVFLSSKDQPFNDWSDRSFSQGFSWRPGSAAFRSLVEDGNHQINIFINEPVPSLPANCIRAIKVPFENSDGNIEIASISDSSPLEIPVGNYSLQVEFMELIEGSVPEINVRFNECESDFEILKADAEIQVIGTFDLMAQPAS